MLRFYLVSLKIARKNVESIAEAAGQVIFVEANLSQALQHFVRHRPWDSRHQMATIRQHQADVRQDPDAAVVVHEVIIPKKGFAFGEGEYGHSQSPDAKMNNC
jgi:SRSO17 transposase